MLKRLGAIEMWGRMMEISGTAKLTNKAALEMARENRELMRTVRRR